MFSGAGTLLQLCRGTIRKKLSETLNSQQRVETAVGELHLPPYLVQYLLYSDINAKMFAK